MHLSAEEITRKQLASSKQLLCPTACSGLGGGQQQDAVGEKWLGDPAAAALRQNHEAGQGQVGSGHSGEAQVWIIEHVWEVAMGAEKGRFCANYCHMSVLIIAERKETD